MTMEQIQHLLAYLGYYKAKVDGIWGEMTSSAVGRFQRAFGLKEDKDPGPDTQKALKHAVAYDMMSEEPEVHQEDFWADIQYFTKAEFACKCGQYHAPYCNGYPHEIQPLLIQICDRARKHFGQPIDIVSGLRCEQHNFDSGGVSSSQHKYGEACDVYVRNVPQKTVLDWFLSQKDVKYAYAIEGASSVHFDIQKGAR